MITLVQTSSTAAGTPSPWPSPRKGEREPVPTLGCALPSPLAGERPGEGGVDAGEGWGGEAVHIRPARIADMRHAEPLINGFARKNLMLPKAPDQLARLFREFVVAEDGEGRLLGCGALRVYNEQLAEIVSLAVDEERHGQGIGRLLVDRLTEEARDLGVKTLFALTLQETFFLRLGFRTVSKANFPLKVWADCRNCPKLHACDEIAMAKEL